jgi:hypothetical protein
VVPTNIKDYIHRFHIINECISGLMWQSGRDPYVRRLTYKPIGPGGGGGATAVMWPICSLVNR